ncbi:type II/IV secretion system protein [Candidatus Berkelbacteria bacterium]|nr:type II/IV secretion system protein [Candidatus Berkelbacteria bacterium]
MTENEISDLLAGKQLVSRERLRKAAALAEGFGRPFTAVLIERGWISKIRLGQTIAAHFGVEFTDWQDRLVPPQVLKLIPEDTAVAKQLMPFARHGKILSVAFANPQDFELINFLQKKTSYRIRPTFSFPEDLATGFAQYKRDLARDFAQIIKQGLPVSGTEQDLAKVAKHIPVIQAFDAILEYAIADRASDIHMEVQEDAALIRFRVDGLLHDVLSLSKAGQAALVARIKVLANLKIDEHRLPQDGRFKFESLGVRIALRVSIIPSFYGENVVLRLLFESEKPRTLEELGFTAGEAAIVRTNIIKTHGMMLVTGPTGSGKTTTLYSILQLLNHPDIKLCTVEDPIEYGIARISQIQVNPLTGLDFATGLRSLLRHDPDIIMVGEIRDAETANTAIQAALTGHLVLSTLHTNDAPSAIPRFLDLGSESFLLASTLKLVIAQRLVRRICPGCRATETPAPSVLADVARLSGRTIASLKKQTFYQGKGCRKCHDTGYRGRFGIYELFEVTPAIEPLIRDRAPVSQIHQTAVKAGMITMFGDGVAKALSGLTTLEEVLRVSRE